MKNKLKAMERSYWRRCCNLTLADKIRNDEIRRRMGVGTTVVDTVGDGRDMSSA